MFLAYSMEQIQIASDKMPLLSYILIFLTLECVCSQCASGRMCPEDAIAEYRFGSWLFRHSDGNYYLNLPKRTRSCNYFRGGCGFFSKVRISTVLSNNLTSIELNTRDGTFRTGVGVDFGECGDCVGAHSASGCSTVDFTGTPFAVQDSLSSWTGWNGSKLGTSGSCPSSHTCTMCCGGFCGQGYFNGVLSVIDKVAFSEVMQTACATFPTDPNLACVGNEIVLLTPVVYCNVGCVCANSVIISNSSSNFSIPCDPGYFYDCGNCVLCSPGTFSDVPGSSSCLHCDFGKISSSVGQSSCISCPPGAYRSNRTYSSGLKWTMYSGYFGGVVPIQESANFTYIYTASGYIPDGLANEGVQGVSSDFSSLHTATEQMLAVNQGSYFTIEWQGYFMANVTGTVTFYLTSDDASYFWFNSPETFSVADADCAVPGTQSMQETQCKIEVIQGTYYHIRLVYGQYQGGCNIKFCLKVPGSALRTCDGLGFYFHETVSYGTACQLCAPGSYSKKFGSSSCSACNPGSYAGLVGNVSCSDCPQGTFAGPGSASCSICLPGKYSSSSGVSYCSMCAPGFYTLETGSSQCKICEEGTFSSGSGSSAACASCLPGSFARRRASAGLQSVLHGGNVFAALDGVDPNQRNISYACQNSFVSIPQGWSLAPDDALSLEVIKAYPWGASFMLLSNSTWHGTSIAGSSAGSNLSAGCLVSQDGQYRSCQCNARILITCNAVCSNFSGGATSCTRCAAGSFSTLQRASSCGQCAAGTFSTAEGMKSNKVCLSEFLCANEISNFVPLASPLICILEAERLPLSFHLLCPASLSPFLSAPPPSLPFPLSIPSLANKKIQHQLIP